MNGNSSCHQHVQFRQALEGWMIRRGKGLCALIALALIGVLTTSTTVALGGPAPAEVTIGGCPVTHASPRRHPHLHRPPQTITRDDRLIAIVKTNCGRF